MASPLAFASLGVGTILVVSGLRGHSVGDTLRGGTKDAPLDPNAGVAPASAADGTDPQDSNPLAAGGNVFTTPIGLVTFDGVKVAAWIAPILVYARKEGWTGRVSSGYRSTSEQGRICATGVKPCAKPGTSNHESVIYPGGAVDVTGAAQLASILQKSKYKNILVYAGAKDPVHFSHPHNGSY